MGEKIEWQGTLAAIQPRIRLTRAFDERSHSYLGYALRVRGIIGEEDMTTTTPIHLELEPMAPIWADEKPEGTTEFVRGKWGCVMLLFAAALWFLSGEMVQAAGGPHRYLSRSDAWFSGEEAKAVAEAILSHQSDLGGWPKNVDTTAAPFTKDPNALKPTFDNGATTDELRFLARLYRATKDDRYRKSFERGLDYILQAQYPTGGWPQFYPPGSKYHRYITFNDSAMVRLLAFLREVYGSEAYGFVDADRRRAAHRAFDRGIECILKCQIRVDGKLTAWCAQHDEKDYRPRRFGRGSMRSARTGRSSATGTGWQSTAWGRLAMSAVTATPGSATGRKPYWSKVTRPGKRGRPAPGYGNKTMSRAKREDALAE